MARTTHLYLIFLLLSFSGISEAQQVYCNSGGDVVYIDSTTITFKLNSYGAFVSSTLGQAKYRRSKNKYCLFGLANVKPFTSSISIKNSPNESAVQVSYFDNTPVQFPAIEFRDSRTDEILIEGFGDKTGRMVIDETSLRKHLGRDLIVLVRSLDFTTEKEITLNTETTYEITSEINFPFVVLSKPKYIKIVQLEDDQIKVTYANKIRTLELDRCPQELWSEFLQKNCH